MFLTPAQITVQTTNLFTFPAFSKCITSLAQNHLSNYLYTKMYALVNSNLKPEDKGYSNKCIKISEYKPQPLKFIKKCINVA